MIFWLIFYFIITHLLICAWVRYDARMRGINYERWYKFCLYTPVIGILIYSITKRTWKSWALMFIFWIFNPGMFFGIRFLLEYIKEKSG